MSQLDEPTPQEKPRIIDFSGRQLGALVGGTAVMLAEMKFGNSESGNIVGAIGALAASSPFVEKLIQYDQQDRDAR